MIDDVIEGSRIFEHLGAATRWTYYLISSELTGNRHRKYSELYDGKKGWKFPRKTKNALYNNLVGTIMLVVILRCVLFIAEIF